MKKTLTFLILIAALIFTIILSLGLGAMRIPVKEVITILASKAGLLTNTAEDPLAAGVILMIRLPRVILGLMVGAALGTTGAAVQGIFRNPLAEPGLIGISAGASMMTVIIIALEGLFFIQISQSLGYSLLAIGAFFGSGLAALLVYTLSKTNGQPNMALMLLAGIAINALAGAFTGLVTYLSSEQQLRSITFWMLGSLGGATWGNVLCIAPFVILPIVILPTFSKGLNVFAIGESQAELIGLNTKSIKGWVVFLSTMAVGASVSVSGIIGFVGLLVPHTMRLIGGVNHKFVLPASALAGALVLTLADLISRTIVEPIELPIGVITALLGTPIFIYIMLRDKKKITNL